MYLEERLETVAQEYLKVLTENEEYDAYTIDKELRVVKVKGAIKNNESYNYHNNYDNSEPTLKVKIDDKSNKWVDCWWTLSEKIAFDKQQLLIEKKTVELQKEIANLSEVKGVVVDSTPWYNLVKR